MAGGGGKGGGEGDERGMSGSGGGAGPAGCRVAHRRLDGWARAARERSCSASSGPTTSSTDSLGEVSFPPVNTPNPKSRLKSVSQLSAHL